MSNTELMARLVLACERIATALEARSKKKSRVISRDPLVIGFLAGVPPEVQETWVQVYGPDRIWVEAQIKEAAAWWTTNPNKRQMGDTVPAFVNRWLLRAKKRLATERAAPPVADSPKEKPKGQSFDFDFDENGRVKLSARELSARDKVVAPWEGE